MIRSCLNCKNTGIQSICKDCSEFEELNQKNLWEKVPKFGSGDFEYDVPGSGDKSGKKKRN